MLVQIFHIFYNTFFHRTRNADAVDHCKMLYIFAEPAAPACGHTLMLNFAAMSKTAITSLMPATRQLSTWQNSIASACMNCLNITLFWRASPVATPIGATARAIFACPRISPGLVGSSIHQGPTSARPFIFFYRFIDIPYLINIKHNFQTWTDFFPNNAAKA